MQIPRPRVLVIWLIVIALVLPQVMWIVHQEMSHWQTERLRASAKIEAGILKPIPEWIPQGLQDRWSDRASDVWVDSSTSERVWWEMRRLRNPFNIFYTNDYPTESDWHSMARCRNLRYLSIQREKNKSQIADIPLSELERGHLTQLSQLKALQLESFKLNEADLETISELKLLWLLSLAGSEIEAKGLVHLRNLPQLTALYLESTNLQDQDLAFIESLESLTSLSLGGRITDTGIQSIHKLQNLEMILFDGCPITDDGLQQILDLPELEHLILLHTNVSEEFVKQLSRTHPHVRIESFR